MHKSKKQKLGMFMFITGIIGAASCFVLFATSTSYGGAIIPFILFLPFGALSAFGGALAGLNKNRTTRVISRFAEIKQTLANSQKTKCPYCGSQIDINDNKCPSCGAPNKKV